MADNYIGPELNKDHLLLYNTENLISIVNLYRYDAIKILGEIDINRLIFIVNTKPNMYSTIIKNKYYNFIIFLNDMNGIYNKQKFRHIAEVINDTIIIDFINKNNFPKEQNNNLLNLYLKDIN